MGARKKKVSIFRKIFYYLPIYLGLIFVVFYINVSTVDVVYTDYIRLINSYLENVYSFKPYMQLDIFTRLPINYLERIINVTFFSYSTTFDMVLGAVSLFASAFVIARYSYGRKINKLIYLVIIMVVFSLNKWEMYTNGSGWVHFLAFTMFFLNYLILDRVYRGKNTNLNKRLLIVIPIFTILFVAGPYSATYALTMLLAYAYMILMDFYRNNLMTTLPRKKKKEDKDLFSKFTNTVKGYMPYIMAVLIPLIMYMISRKYSIEEHAGATKKSMSQVFAENPLIFPKMFIKSFSSMFIGSDYAIYNHVPNSLVLILGCLLILIYLYAIRINIRKKIYLKTIFPMLLIISGGLNHLLITLSRWIFLKEEYVMSSRYALQYQVGIIGILLTFALAIKREDLTTKKLKKTNKKIKSGFHKVSDKIYVSNIKQELEKKKSKKIYLYDIITVAVCILVIVSQVVFYKTELATAPYRKNFFEERKQAALNYENLSDKEIKKYFQYKSVEKTKEALKLLKDRKLNVFSGNY